MKLLLVFVMPALLSCRDAPPSAPVPEMTTVTVAVEGMHCPGCVMAIQEAVEHLEGVSACRVSLETGKAVVEHEVALVSAAHLVRTIEGLGFQVARGDAAAAAPEEESPTP